MNSPKVSVLMPNYNCEKYLPEAIESILNQTFTDFEFIIVDDGSSDSSWDIIQEYADKDERIITKNNKENLGITKTRNKLLWEAKWKYIVWEDSDDISTLDRIEKQFNYMENHPEVWACWWGLQFFDESWNTSQRLYVETDKEIRKNIFRYSPFSQWAWIYLLKAVKESWLYDEAISTAEDLDLSFRIWQTYHFGNIKDIVLHYRQHSSDTHKNLKQMELNTLSIRWKNHKTEYYNMSIWDKIYNLLQYISIYIIPSKLKIALFNLIRNN